MFLILTNKRDTKLYKNKTKTRTIRYKLRPIAGFCLKLTLLLKIEKYVTLVRNSHAATKVSKGKYAMSQ